MFILTLHNIVSSHAKRIFVELSNVLQVENILPKINQQYGVKIFSQFHHNISQIDQQTKVTQGT